MKKTKIPIGIKALCDHTIGNVTQKIENCENQVIKQVLQGLLLREPNKEDYDNCIIAIEKGVTDRYNVIYCKVNLGMVLKDIRDNECIVSFIPDNNFNLTN